MHVLPRKANQALRSLRAATFPKLGIKPQRLGEMPHARAGRALDKLKGTYREKMEIFKLIAQAQKRLAARKEQGARGSLSEDAFILELNEHAEKLLGKKRADRFFDMVNDPYF